MEKVLIKTITDERLAWKRNSFSKKDISFNLSKNSIEELTSALESFPVIQRIGMQKCKLDFTYLEKDMHHVKTNFLDNDYGIVLISNLPEVTDANKLKSFWIMANLLGEPMKQTTTGEKLVKVTHMQKSMAQGGRYHESRDSGSIHTDGLHFQNIPDYIGLLCLQSGFTGGESILVSAYSVHNRLLQHSPDLLKVLYEEFYIDKKISPENLKPGEEPYLKRPIIRNDDGNLIVRYLKDYIISGHKKAGTDFTPLQLSALEALDEVLEDNELRFIYKLEKRDICFANNPTTFHGRTAYEDNETNGVKRHLERIWIQKNI